MECYLLLISFGRKTSECEQLWLSISLVALVDSLLIEVWDKTNLVEEEQLQLKLLLFLEYHRLN